MTKRFTISNHCRIKDETQIGFFNIANNIDAKRVCDLLNELNDENKQLKNEIEKLSYANEDLLEEKRIWKQMSEEYTKLSYENEQLKSRVEYLERKIDRERTSYQKQHEKWEEEIQKEINQELSNIISAIEKGSCRSRWFS